MDPFRLADRGLDLDGDSSEEIDELDDNDDPPPVVIPKPKKPRQRANSTRTTSSQTTLPLARVEGIVNADPDNGQLSKEAIFTLTMATEEFIRNFIQMASTRAEHDRRSLISYRDMAATVAQFDEFRFLDQMIPMPVHAREALSLREQILATQAQNAEATEEENPFPSLVESSSTKGKGKARASTNKSQPNGHAASEQTNGRSTAKGKGKAKAAAAPPESISTGGRGSKRSMPDDMDVDSVSSLSDYKVPSISTNGTSSRSKSRRTSTAKSAVPTPPSLEPMVPASSSRSRNEQDRTPPLKLSLYQRTSTATNGTSSSGNANGHDHDASPPSPDEQQPAPLWTRVPLPPPPSASTSHSRRFKQSMSRGDPLPPPSPAQAQYMDTEPADWTPTSDVRSEPPAAANNHAPYNRQRHASSPRYPSKLRIHHIPHSPHSPHASLSEVHYTSNARNSSPPLSPNDKWYPPQSPPTSLQSSLGQPPGRTIYSHQPFRDD